MRKKFPVLIAFIALSFFGCGTKPAATSLNETPAEYKNRIEKWQAEYERSLTADDGWLTLAGLFWLEEGENSIGTGSEFDIELPERLRSGKFGTIILKDGSAELKVEKGVAAFVDEKQVTDIALAPDTTGKPTIVKSGDIEFLLLKRNERSGIRVRDKKNPDRVNFKGLDWFPIDQKFEITADFESFDKDRDMPVPNVLGQTVQMKSPGLLRFKIGGQDYTLQPAHNGDGRLFIIFRDTSSKTETYGAGRFLYTKMPENGKVVLDFNKAENPPCAYTDFATCPLPPSQNELDIDLNAGEMDFKKH
ncbi:MAG: DUF1684 domain-containing protein [Pyrinomonadaceae bacterium]